MRCWNLSRGGGLGVPGLYRGDHPLPGLLEGEALSSQGP